VAQKILVVDDDRDLVEMVNFALRRAGYDVLRAGDGPTALRMVEEQEPDLAVLDVNIGAWNGFDILREIRKRSQIPVIMLTGRDAEEDKVRGLQLGADDYVVKPFSYRELVARIEAHIRRHRQTAPQQALPQTEFQVGPLHLDTSTHEATKQGEPIKLTATEFRLLHCLMEQAGRVVPTRTILREVWGYDDPSGADLVRVTAYRLRQKIEDDPATPVLLHTVSGVGLMVKVPDPE
jgi:DNA-binding response OmpR family regulator